jgi:hypothetical protein
MKCNRIESCAFPSVQLPPSFEAPKVAPPPKRTATAKPQLDAAAQNAVAAVDAAAAKLPKLDPAELTFAEGGFGVGVNPETADPPEEGSKVRWVTADTCLIHYKS